jgi:hypothetical protein
LTKLFLIRTFFHITVLTSCGQQAKEINIDSEVPKNVDSFLSITPKLIDYKSDTYKISLGDNFTRSCLIIDWHWAAEADIDGIPDSLGKDSYMFLGEPLIKYNDGECLPSLHIETDRNIITSFTCSVLFNLADTSNAETEFLSILSKDIKQLQNAEIIKSLTEQGVYEIKTQEFIEAFKLTRGKEYEYDKFEYVVKPK